MADIAVRNFQKRYHGRYLEYANWPLNRPVALGDVGKWSSGKVFSYEFNISSHGFKLETRNGATTPGRELEGGVARAYKAAGKAPVYNSALVEARAGVSLAMKKSASFLLEAKILKTESVANMTALEKTLVNLAKDADWWKHRVIIVSILKADITTAAMTYSDRQRVEINADASTPVPFKLTDVNADLQLAFRGEGASVDLLVRDAVVAFQHATLRKGKWYQSWEVSQLLLETNA